MTTLKILTAARELLSDEKRWTKGRAQREVNGLECYCWLGAVWHVAGGVIKGNTESVENIMTDVAHDRGFVGLVKFNDDPATTHAMILDAFDSAIEKAKST